MADKTLTTIKKIANHLLTLLEVETKGLNIAEKDGATWIEFESADSNLLIGYHGETLNDLQLLIALMASQELGDWQKIVVNINNWREVRDEQLRKLAATYAQRAKFSGTPQVLPSLSASERRVIHLYLADYPDLVSVSEGEGQSRRLIVKPKEAVSAKL